MLIYSEIVFLHPCALSLRTLGLQVNRRDLLGGLIREYDLAAA